MAPFLVDSKLSRPCGPPISNKFYFKDIGLRKSPAFSPPVDVHKSSFAMHNDSSFFSPFHQASRFFYHCLRREVGKIVASASGTGSGAGEDRDQVRNEEIDPKLYSEMLDKGPIMERSVSSNEELLLFFFQLDLGVRLQRALNLDQYEPAKQIREKIAETEREITRQREAKAGSASSKDEAQDKALAILRLRSNLQKAIEDERYEDAASIKESLSKLESEALAASAMALASKNVKYNHRLGQKIKHRVFGYRGVICGMDSMCTESEEWMHNALIHKLRKGKNQPFYQVLVEMSNGPGFLVAYLAEENIVAPEEPDLDYFEHPYTYLLFYGVDANGDFIATKQLREKYNAPRHEIPYEDNDKTPDNDTDKNNGN